MTLNAKPIVIISWLVAAMLLSCVNAKKTGNAQPQEETHRPPAMAELWQEFTRAHDQWTVDWNEATGTPHRATGPAIRIPGFTKITKENIEDAAWKFLTENQKIMGVEPNKLKLIRANEVNDRWYVSYKQIEHGLEVLKSEVELRIFRNGKVMAFGADFFGHIDVSPSATISRQSARQHAISERNFNPETDSVDGDSTLYYLPVILGKAIDYYLVYRVEVKVKQPLGNYIILVDAHSGEIRERRNLVRHSN